MVSVAAPPNMEPPQKSEFPILLDAAGNFMQQLLAAAHQLNSRSDQIENTLKQLYEVVDSKANQTELDQLTTKVKSQEVTEIVASLGEVTERVSQLEQNHGKLEQNLETKAPREEMVQVTADLTTVLNEKSDKSENQLQEKIAQIEKSLAELNTSLNTMQNTKADQQTALDLIATMRIKANQQDIDDLSVRVSAGEEERCQINANSEKKLQDISAILNAKANKQELRRFHRVTTVNNWRVGQKVFQQAAGCVVNDYRASMVMDIGFRYKMALQVTDHNRQQGPFVEAAVALLPESSSAWMNCDWGNGKGWAADGTFPGVGLMNLNGSQKSHILTTGDVLDISLDHYTGQHIVEFRKRGSELSVRRRVAPQPLNLVVSLWGRAGLELIEFDVIDAS